jgi:hypothetical protein
VANISCIFTTITGSTIYKIHTEKEEGMEYLGDYSCMPLTKA